MAMIVICGSINASDKNRNLDRLVMKGDLTTESKIKQVRELIKSGIDVNTLYNVNMQEWWAESSEKDNSVDCKATALGIAVCHRNFYDQSAIAHELVKQGATLAGSYNKQFGFYFIKQKLDYDNKHHNRTLSYGVLETLLYSRMKRCYKETMTFYLIVNRVKNKKDYLKMSFVIPRPVLDIIESFIMTQGVQDILTVLNETVVGCDNKKYTLYQAAHSLLTKKFGPIIFPIIFNNNEGRAFNIPSLYIFDADRWEKDFNEFFEKRKDTAWFKKPKNLKDIKNVVLMSVLRG